MSGAMGQGLDLRYMGSWAESGDEKTLKGSLNIKFKWLYFQVHLSSQLILTT